jgi:acyl-CoA synthetase (NDP forming)
MSAIASAHAAPLVAPRVVALVGVSDGAGKLSGRPFHFCRQHGFTGQIYIVNPRRDTVLGETAYPSVVAIPVPVDHAYLLVGTGLVEAALDDCIAAGVKVVTVLADGFAEAGDAGRARQARLVAKANAAGIMLIGPNSMGVVNSGTGFVCTTNAAFKTADLLPGRLAVLSHSGSLIGTLLSRGTVRNIGFSHFVSLGNEAQTCVGTVGLTLVDNPDIDGFVLFLETMRNAKAFARFAAAARNLGKPVVAYVLGKSREGQALSVSHTGALTGEAAAVGAFLRHHQIAEVSQLDALFEAPALMLQKPRLADRPRVATVLTTTGGGGAMLVDQLSLRGVALAGLGPDSADFFRRNDIPFGSGKLVDVTLAGAQYDVMKAAITQLITDATTGLLVVAIGSSAQFNPELAVKPIIDAVAENPGAAPVAAFPLPHAPDSMAMLQAAGIPAFGGVESAADTIALFLADDTGHDEPEHMAPDVAQKIGALIAAHSAGAVLDEVHAGDIFTVLGIEAPPAVLIDDNLVKGDDLDTVLDAAGVAYPVVAKLVSPDLPHKTEYGAVTLTIMTGDALETAIATMRTDVACHAPHAQIDAVLIQPMVTGLGEALVGFRRDNLVGPVVTVGAGGVMAEIYRDVAIRPAPVSVQTARQMLDEVKGFALLRGYRGRPVGDLDALARLVASVSQLAAFDAVAEAEINPVLVRADGVVRLDALIRLGDDNGDVHG